ncbi:eukaryotic mitochondrial regulator protein-domain-containing protein [Xylogone sp. PMI_703]|nr:eukaryotic mitochondrial regulator protein-domain-containing protein [Xylogone sp. PMI_703]
MATPTPCRVALSSVQILPRHLGNCVQSSRSFSSTSKNEARLSRQRRQMYRWLTGQGQNFEKPLAGSTNYLSAYTSNGQLKRALKSKGEKGKNEKGSDGETSESLESTPTGSPNGQEIPPESTADLRPFPLNRAFISQAVLSDEMRETIWERVMREGKSVREVSAELGVEMSRVGAVVRLKEIEKEWKRKGKKLATPYQEAMLSMLPTTKYVKDDRSSRPHESINDLPVHTATGQQIFWPTSESRHFTRTDAAKVFDETLLPADDRVPHPELAIMERERHAGLSDEERRALARVREEDEERKRRIAAERRAKQEAGVKKIETVRWQFRIQDINVDDAGTDGRGYKGVGWRYGVPHMDRSKGQIKIPTKVE